MNAVFVPEIEIEEHDVVLATQRTVPLYPTYGPGDGRSWNEFFREVKAAGNYASDDDEPVEVEAVEVLTPAYLLADPLKARGAAGTCARRLAAQGWDVRVQQSLARVPPTLYKNASKDGEHQAGDVLYEGYELEMTCLLAVKRAGGQMLAIEATWSSKEGFISAETHDPILGRERRTTVLKPRKQRDWEKVEGVPGTLGLSQWLSIVAPVAKKTSKKEAA